jgi:hypothetical protein
MPSWSIKATSILPRREVVDLVAALLLLANRYTTRIV